MAPRTANLWFQSDVSRVFANMTDRLSDHRSTQVHPVFDLVEYAQAYVISHVLHAGSWTTARLMLGVNAAVLVSSLFVLLRAAGLATADAVLFSAFGMCTASIVFYVGVPETHVLSAASVLLALVVLAVQSRHRVPDPWIVVGSALSLCMTVTHWMAGIVVTVLARPLRRAALLIAIAFAAVLLVALAQKAVMPSARLFLRAGKGEGRYMYRPAPARLVQVVTTLFVHGGVMPPVRVARTGELGAPPASDESLLLTVQDAKLGDARGLSAIAIGAWLTLLALGAVALARGAYAGRFALGFAAVLAGQCALYAVYGEETFLYTPTTTMLLVVVSAAAVRGPTPRIARVVAIIGVVGLAMANWARFTSTVDDAARQPRSAQSSPAVQSPVPAR